MSSSKQARQLKALRNVLEEIRSQQEIDIVIHLWDGSEFPLARKITSPLRVIISGPGVIGAILRRPNIDTLVRLLAKGGVVLEGGTLLDLVDLMPDKASRKKAKKISKRLLVRSALPFLTSTDWHASATREFEGNAETREKAPDINAPPIEFHYSVGNDFYKLFLDEEMQYTCAHFTDWNNSLEQAQRDKMEISCRKLRLKPGETLLDIGCGWGTFACYAAKNFGVKAHGVTLATKQWEYAQENIKRLGLEGQVTIDLQDYSLMEGQYDKISAIGLFEHIGPSNAETYMTTVHRLLKDDGLFLHHAITRGAKRSKRKFNKVRPEHKMIRKYIFPGSELDHIGHTVEMFEAYQFEVHDVEGWREHYALTCKIWCERLYANRERAIANVGEETYRLWLAYLAGVSIAFTRSSILLYQTLVSKKRRGASPVPPSRADLYR